MDTKENTKEIFKEYIKKIFSFNISPTKHFNRLIITSLVILIFVIVFHGYLYYRITYFDIKKSSELYPVPVPTINNNKLEKIINKFNEKAKTQQSILTATSSVVDPSR
jgi:hypothetical protein